MSPSEIESHLDELHVAGIIDANTRRLLRDRLKFADVEAQQTFQWIEATAEYAAGLSTPSRPHPDTVAVFWVRLAGTLIDVRERIAATSAEWSAFANGRPELLAMTAQLRAVLDALNDARAVLADDEAFYLEYRRHVECHPLQDGYRLRRGKKGALVDTRRSPILGRVVSHDESERMLAELLRRYASETSIAIDFARRIAPSLALVSDRARPLYKKT